VAQSPRNPQQAWKTFSGRCSIPKEFLLQSLTGSVIIKNHGIYSDPVAIFSASARWEALGIILGQGVCAPMAAKDCFPCILVCGKSRRLLAHMDTFDSEAGMRPLESSRLIVQANRDQRARHPDSAEHLPVYRRNRRTSSRFFRSMKSKEINHELGPINYLLTGYLPFVHPGVSEARVQWSRRCLVPRMVSAAPTWAVPNTFPSYGGGYLGGRVQPVHSPATRMSVATKFPRPHAAR